MNIRAGLVGSFLVSALLFAASTADAQVGGYYFYDDPPSSSEDSMKVALTAKYSIEFGHIAVRYWEHRLMAYKARIDQIFSADDLRDLNHLRVRYRILALTLENLTAAANRRHDSIEEAESAKTVNAASSSDTITAVAPDVIEADEVIPADDITETDTSSHYEYVPPTLEEYRIRREDQRLKREKLKLRYLRKWEQHLDEEEEAYKSGFTDDVPDRRSQDEYSEMPTIAKWLARGYRSKLDDVGTMVVNDIEVFVDSLLTHAARFTEAHAYELQFLGVDDGELNLVTWMHHLKATLGRPNVMKAHYQSEIEPFILLYQGGDLRSVLGTFARRAPISEFSELSLLNANTPNPAVASTTISYTLPTASSHTTLRLFNSQGAMAVELDQGAKAAGEHSVVVDVSSLVSGSYLYQLSAQLSTGEKVSSQ